MSDTLMKKGVEEIGKESETRKQGQVYTAGNLNSLHAAFNIGVDALLALTQSRQTLISSMRLLLYWPAAVFTDRDNLSVSRGVEVSMKCFRVEKASVLLL